MSSASNIYITPSTSLLLIRNVSTPTFVYLSSFNTPNFQVTIRDTTGSPTIATSSVRISTIGNARFLDGTSLYVLDKPYGLVNLSFRNSSFWQVLHTSGQAPATAAANVTNLGVSTLIASFISSASKVASSLTIGNLLTTNAIVINSPFIITNLSAPGIVLTESTFNVMGNVTLDNRLFVSGPTTFQGDLQVTTLLPVSSPTRVLGSVGIGGSLFVGGGTSVLSTLQTFSTNTIQSLDVQLSTPNASLRAGTLQVQDLISSLSSLTIQNLFVTLGTLQVNQNVSSVLGSVSTLSLDARNYVLVQSNVSTLGNATFQATLDIVSSLHVLEDIKITTSLTSYQGLFTSSLSSVSLSSLGSLSTSLLRLTSSASISSGLSTAFLTGIGQISIGSYFYTPAVLSSQTLTKVGGDIQVRESALVGTAHVSSGVGVGTDLDVRGPTFVGAAEFQGILSTAKTLTTFGYTHIQGNVGVGSSAFVNSNVKIQDFSEISSFFVNSFLLSNLNIVTSSPALDFSASTLNASTLRASFLTIGLTTPETLTRYSTFASTTQFTYAMAEHLQVENVITSNFWWGETLTTLAPESNPRFVFHTDVNFPQALSTNHIQGYTIDTDRIEASFLGDGANISNVAVPYRNISGFTTFASTISTTFLTTSSIRISTFFNQVYTEAFSSFQSPTFVLEGVGYPLRSDVNQILSLRSNAMVINQRLFLDTRNAGVGYNISSVSNGLDISGLFVTSNIVFSSINPLYLSTQGTAFFSTTQISSLFVRDSLRFATEGIQFFASNSFTATQTPLEVQVSVTPTDSFGLYSLPSSLSLNNRTFVFFSTNRVFVNGLSSSQVLEPAYDLVVRNTLATQTSHLSSLNVTGYLQTTSFTSPSLAINTQMSYPINRISSSAQTLYFNSTLMTLKNSQVPAMGIKTITPGATLQVQGNAFFSSLIFTGVPQANYLRLGSQLL